MISKNSFYQTILDNLFDGVYLVDRNRLINYWNKGAERITGFSGANVIGHKCYENILMHVDRTGKLLCNSGCPLVYTMEDGISREAEVYLHHSDGHRIPVLVRVNPLRNEAGEIVGAVESFSDDSNTLKERRRADAYKKEALEDTVTGIGNRRYIESKLHTALIESIQLGTQMGLLMVDIDHFKRVNDAFGHEVGDQALRMVAKTLESNIRGSDFLGRWGGEEFVLIIQDLNRESLKEVAEKLCALVGSAQLKTTKGAIKLTVSIGAILSYPEDTPETIITKADELMYKSKKAGRNQVTFLF